MSGQALAETCAGASAVEVATESMKRAAAGDWHEWILRLPEAQVLEQARKVDERAGNLDAKARAEQLPLLGMTFAVKDNIDVEGLPTTNGCDYRQGGAPVAKQTAAAVRRILEAGAVLIGKTNMDCAATGLVGVRSAYGACQNAFNRSFISGGSSSGSAVVVATGQVSFSLGTDTAGSGRVPAMFNNIVGLKASRGLVSTHGLVAACRSLDCISVFSLTVPEAWTILRVAVGAEGDDDPWDRPPRALNLGSRLASGTAKFRFAVPSASFLDFDSFGEAAKSRVAHVKEAWAKSMKLLESLGGTMVEVDYSPFMRAAQLLYEGPWVAERLSALSGLLARNPEVIFPTVRTIVEGATKASAKEAFEAFYKLRELKVLADKTLRDAKAEVLVTPTAGAIYTIAEVLADPIALNSNLGRFTNHMNLLDLCGIAVPTAIAGGLPYGVTISAQAGSDALICDIAARVHLASGLTAGATISKVPDLLQQPHADRFLAGVPTIEIAVSGAHMEGLALNWQLVERGARFVREAKTVPYRLLAFTGMTPPRPGLAAAAGKGAPIELEIWELPSACFGSFMKLVAAPLGIGWVELQDGSKVQGFRLVDEGADKAGVVGGSAGAPLDITGHGGWRAYLESTGISAKRQRV